MSTRGVFPLQDCRSRRNRRLKQALALYSADGERARLVRLLASATAATHADRAALVWVDEYGPEFVHGHVTLDLGADRPRRVFSAVPLRASWSEGVPGVFDTSERGPCGKNDEGNGARSTFAIALGSDGLKAWFLVVDSQTPRAKVSKEARARMMFLAGECSAILMHRDMPRPTETVLVPEGGRDRFAAWPILKDIEGHEADEALNQRISLRFLVTRVIRSLLDDDMETDAEALRYQVACVRREMGKQFWGDPEREQWLTVLTAAESGDLFAFVPAVIGLGLAVEEQSQFSGARELYRSAYELAMSIGCEQGALDASRFAGRTCRRSSAWDPALGWYAVAQSLASARGEKGKEAMILTGIGNIHREKGNLPRARFVFQEALDLAEESGDRNALGTVYHDLMALAFSTKDFEEAIRMGWKAVTHYERDQDRLQALTSLAGVFVAAGALDAAESAFEVVAERLTLSTYRLYALSGLAAVAAYRGDSEEFERRQSLLESAGFAEGPASFRAEAWIERGKAYEALMNPRRAEKCFREALAVAEEHRLGQVLLEADALLLALAHADALRPEPRWNQPIDGMEEIQTELRRMREGATALAGC